MRRGLVLFCFLLSVGTAQAEDALLASHIISGDEILLSDGRTLRLADIEASADAKVFLETNIEGHAVSLQNAAPDRYGRIAAVAQLQGQNETIEDVLLQRGLAFVYPATGDLPQLDAMLEEERTARRAGLGRWAQPDTSSDDAEKLYGRYGFVTGTVTKAERVKNKVYLNFGADWRTDFTIAIAAHDLRAFKNRDLDPLTWQGKKVRVRGWVKRDFGPMITVTDPRQIELMP